MAEKIEFNSPKARLAQNLERLNGEQATELKNLLLGGSGHDLLKRKPDEITSTIDSGIAMDRSMSDWRQILTKECQVYVYEQQYLGKRFDQVHYKYMGVDEAKEVLIDNLYAILLYKYFPKINDEIYNKIDAIVKAMSRNIKTFLTRISFMDENGSFQGLKMQRIPNSAVAFANGVFDFKENRFIQKYEKIYVPGINNTIILYPTYIIEWNFDFDFEPLPINIMDTPFEEFVDLMKTLDLSQKNYCWELFYNMSHDINNRLDYNRMIHLSEILGYTLIPQFLQYFVLLIGSGQNGKNSLFDGCFSAKVTPRPVANSIESIENDRFITASLENACHNIFLETSAKTYTDSNMLKALTGSMFQTIENKGVNKYAGVINCKYVFAGNDQSKIKFSDTTMGFRRRINIFEIYYAWDAEHRFMKYGDYYATDFSGDLRELKSDITNTICYIYLGMYGILSATRRFTRDFKFNHNEWTDAYSDIDVGLKEFFNEIIEPEQYFSIWGDTRVLDDEHQKSAFYADNGRTRIYSLDALKPNGVFGFEQAVRYFKGTTKMVVVGADMEEDTIDESNVRLFFADKDFYVSLIYLRSLAMKLTKVQIGSQREFNDNFKKIFPGASYYACSKRELYVRMRLIGNKLRFVSL